MAVRARLCSGQGGIMPAHTSTRIRLDALAFVLLLYGMLALYARLAAVPRGPSPILGLVLSLAGIALIMPMLGVETFILPIVGLMFLSALLLLAVGSISFARAIWRSGVLPRGAGVLLAIGLARGFQRSPRLTGPSAES